MKKTLIALMAMAGVASAASVDYTKYESLGLAGDKLLAAYDFSSPTASVGSLGLQDSFTTSSGVATFGGESGRPWQQGSFTISGDFTISMDLLTLGSNGNWAGLLAIHSDTDAGGGYKYSMLLQVTDSKELALCSSNGGETSFANNASYNIGTGIYTSDQEDKNHASGQTITFVQDASAGTLSLYVDGVEIQTVEEWKPGDIKIMQFGSAFYGYYKIDNCSIDNFAVWNKALSAAEVSSLIVPEPATATLSLLALAGLAARRRRK